MRKNPTPLLLKSVAKHVGLSTSKCFIPSETLAMISSFANLNLSSRVLDQAKGTSGFSRCLKGSIIWDIAKLYDTWFTIPKKDLASEMLVGGGNARIDSISFVLGLTPSGVISSPAKFTVSFPNWNLLGLNIKPALLQAFLQVISPYNSIVHNRSPVFNSLHNL